MSAPSGEARRRFRRRPLWVLAASTALVGVLLAVLAQTAFAQTSVEPREAVPELAPDSDGKRERMDEAVQARIEDRDERLTGLLDEYLADSGVRLAISVEDLVSGESFDYASGEQFATASTAKVNILAALLLQAQDEDRELSAEERRQARGMITFSENDPANALHARIGSSEGFAEAMAEFGFTDTEPGSGGVWGATQTTTADQLRLLRALAKDDSPLSETNRTYVGELMADVTEEQAWGVSAAAGPGDTVELKNGWMPRDADGGRWAVNSLGRVRGSGHDYLIAVYSDQNSDYDSGVQAVEFAVSEIIGGLAPAGEPAEDQESRGEEGGASDEGSSDGAQSDGPGEPASDAGDEGSEGEDDGGGEDASGEDSGGEAGRP